MRIAWSSTATLRMASTGQEAVALAIASRALINYAAGQYVRDAIGLGCVAWVNEALETRTASLRRIGPTMPRRSEQIGN
jgi:hypothetical protein